MREDFYKNILQASYTSQDLIESKQDMSANALLVKFSWLHTNLRSIFWTDDNTFLQNQKLDQSVYFDFSAIINFTPHRLIRFIVDVITTKLMVELDYSQNIAMNKKKFVIFLDEAQILMPAKKSSELSRLEEALSTFRYKGVAVVVTGISAEYISKIALVKTGFMAQFRSDSSLLLSRLGAAGEDHKNNVAQLPKYHCYLRGLATNTQAKIVQIAKFSEEKQTENIYNKWLSKISKTAKTNFEDFSLSSEFIWYAKISASCNEDVSITHTTEYSYLKLVNEYLGNNTKIDPRLMFSKRIEEHLDQWFFEFNHVLAIDYQIDSTDKELQDILLIFVIEILVRLSQIVKDDNRIGTLERGHKLMMQIAKKRIVNHIENIKQEATIDIS